MSEDVYTRLREFMDKLPAGYPTTPSGVEIKILKRLFTPEQAELVMKLSKDPEDIATIAQRTGIDESELSERLEELAQRGCIFRTREGDKPLYQAFQFIVGIYEFQLKHLDREFCELFEEYLPYFGISLAKVKTSQLRVVPLESSLKTTPAVASYNRIRELVREQELISVSQCICRKEQGLLGNECSRPQETCMAFGDFARYYIENEMGRQIDTDEALRILDLAEESGLVLSPSNTQKLEALCCCCPCCCPILRYGKMAPKPADFVRSYYRARIDPDLCSACGTCLERCQMDAIREMEDFSEIIEERCIGCGLCVSTCPEEAISMVAKPEMEAPPSDFREALRRIEREREML
jgi:electron transport complex protein RnfB